MFLCMSTQLCIALCAHLLGRRRATVTTRNMLSATASRLPSDCSAAQSSGCIPHTKRPARRAQPVLASAGQQASGGGQKGPFRKVLFIQFKDSSERLENVTQKSLDELREKHKAEGFAAPDGCCTQDLADLPERANVRVMYKQDVYKTIRQVRPGFVCWFVCVASSPAVRQTLNTKLQLA
ncbi:hypothetical protein ABPG77_007885 [Micractinium sp. CCAP 211/92]